MNILAVDDEPSVGTSLSFALAGPGRRLATACNGEEALAKIAEPPPFDIVITDHNMPRVSGLDLVKRLRADRFAGKIVVLSAHLTEDNRRLYAELTVDSMIDKPFDVRKIRDVIDALGRAA